MNAIKKLGLASAAAMALSSGSASAADYLFNFQFDALDSAVGYFAATNIVYLADNLDPNTLTYVSGDVNGATSPGLLVGFGPTERRFEFLATNFAAPIGTVANIEFLVNGPFAAGMTQEAVFAARGISFSAGVSYALATGRLSIFERVAAVPEPTTWAMMLIGFMAVGGALRGRGRLHSVRAAYV